jgi:TonB-dependent SusC/RagA subfamily outer membrane receptor
MKKTLFSNGFMHSNAFIKASACLLLSTGTAIPVMASQESSGNPSPTIVQQNTTVIKGSVVDANGEPIIGASVVEKGSSSNGTVTDMNGDYTLNVKRGSSVIISYVGFITQEVTKGGQLTLKEDLKSLNEVVVIGYGTQRKGDITSAITSVKAEDFSKGNIKDAGDLIKGKVAGLTISNGSGDPSVASSIRLRGIISLNGGNTPLVLVDGIEGSLSTVAPEDIASVDVLKDASAAAIYGTRGAAGVIIITTKSGKRDAATTVNYSGYMSLSSFGKKLDMMDGTDVRNGLTEFNDKGYDTDWLGCSDTYCVHPQS